MCYQMECLYYLQKLLQWKLLHDDNDSYWLEVSIPLSLLFIGWEIFSELKYQSFVISLYKMSCKSEKRDWDADVMINRTRNSRKKYYKHKGLFHVRLCQQPLWCLQQKKYLDSSFSSYKPMTHRNALDIYEVNLLEGLKVWRSYFCSSAYTNYSVQMFVSWAVKLSKLSFKLGLLF